MSVITMNMSQGNIEQDEPLSSGYDEEIMNSGWIPATALAQLVSDDQRKSFPAAMANVDWETFLKKMYG
jgi:hypothetical protein